MYYSTITIGTFFLRTGFLAVLLSGCHRNTEITRGQPAPRPDTVVVMVPLIRFTPTDNANSSTPIDSVALALIERRVMSRMSSLQRANTELAAGTKTFGVTPAKNAAPEIHQGFLGAISFSNDGSLERTSLERIAAIAELLKEIPGSLEIKAVGATNMSAIDVAIARARRVYLELLASNSSLAERDVAITITAQSATTPSSSLQVEIFWRAIQ